MISIINGLATGLAGLRPGRASGCGSGLRRRRPGQLEDGKSYICLDYDTNSHFEREGENLAEEIFGR